MSQSSPLVSPHAPSAGHRHNSQPSAVGFSSELQDLRSLPMSYCVALLSAVVVILLRGLLTPLWGSQLPFLTLYPGVLVSTWYGGLGPGLVTTALCAVASAYFWLAPFHSLAVSALADQVGLALAVLVMLMIAYITAALRRTQRQLEDQVHLVQARTAELAQTNATLRDEIAVRRRVETTLRQAHEKLRAHIENTPLAVIEWDQECRVREWSLQAGQLFAWTAEEVRGKRLDEIGFLPEEDVATVQEEIHHLLIHGLLGDLQKDCRTSRGAHLGRLCARRRVNCLFHHWR